MAGIAELIATCFRRLSRLHQALFTVDPRTYLLPNKFTDEELDKLKNLDLSVLDDRDDDEVEERYEGEKHEKELRFHDMIKVLGIDNVAFQGDDQDNLRKDKGSAFLIDDKELNTRLLLCRQLLFNPIADTKPIYRRADIKTEIDLLINRPIRGQFNVLIYEEDEEDIRANDIRWNIHKRNKNKKSVVNDRQKGIKGSDIYTDIPRGGYKSIPCRQAIINFLSNADISGHNNIPLVQGDTQLALVAGRILTDHEGLYVAATTINGEEQETKYFDITISDNSMIQLRIFKLKDCYKTTEDIITELNTMTSPDKGVLLPAYDGELDGDLSSTSLRYTCQRVNDKEVERLNSQIRSINNTQRKPTYADLPLL